MRTLFALVVTTVLLACGAAQAQDQPGCLKVESIKAPHRFLEPGGEMKVKVKLKTSHCFIPTDPAGTTAKLSIEPAPAFESTSGAITYSGFEGAKPPPDVLRAHEIEAVVDLKASQFLFPGKYDVRAFVIYKAVDEQGRVTHEIVFFTIPVNVARSAELSFWDEHPKVHKTLVTTGLVLLAIAAMPLIVVLALLGGLPDC